MHRSFILSITFTSNVGQLCKNWPINQTLKAILFIDLPPNNIFVYKLSYSGSKLLNRFFFGFCAVAPDAIYSHVKTYKEEAKNMHYAAPEYAGILLLNSAA